MNKGFAETAQNFCGKAHRLGRDSDSGVGNDSDSSGKGKGRCVTMFTVKSSTLYIQVRISCITNSIYRVFTSLINYLLRL